MMFAILAVDLKTKRLTLEVGQLLVFVSQVDCGDVLPTMSSTDVIWSAQHPVLEPLIILLNLDHLGKWPKL
jgi:hypothetical protein